MVAEPPAPSSGVEPRRVAASEGGGRSFDERSFCQAKVDSNRLVEIKEAKIGNAKRKAEKRKHNENIQWERN